ncbi:MULTISPECIES: hypothetical protein [unclassified Bartonella]|uniref:hypothetical protein n=1 Tax=unclassified Bartonella TaxID=2645622 RepID=UPI0035D0F0BC
MKRYRCSRTNDICFEKFCFTAALAKAFHLGKQSERQKQTENALKTATTRLEVENEVNQKSDAGVRSELSRWVRGK